MMAASKLVEEGKGVEVVVKSSRKPAETTALVGRRVTGGRRGRGRTTGK
jgi:hypothetical protein